MPAPVPPKPPKPAVVSFIAFPGGLISVDGVQVGRDATAAITLKPGTHTLRVANRFLGDHVRQLELGEGQRGEIVIEW